MPKTEKEQIDDLSGRVIALELILHSIIAAQDPGKLNVIIKGLRGVSAPFSHVRRTSYFARAFDDSIKKNAPPHQESTCLDVTQRLTLRLAPC